MARTWFPGAGVVSVAIGITAAGRLAGMTVSAPARAVAVLSGFGRPTKSTFFTRSRACYFYSLRLSGSLSPLAANGRTEHGSHGVHAAHCGRV